VGYRERLVPGPGTIAACLLLLPAVLLVLLPFSRVGGVTAAVLLTAATIAGLAAGAPVVAIEDGMLRAGRARIDVRLTGPAEALHGDDARTARGTGLDARAWTVLRAWVDGVVRVPLQDPADPAPYWLVSSRHPEELAAALERARAAAPRT
jgi:Protein of unknown function (DUF3093)